MWHERRCPRGSEFAVGLGLGLGLMAAVAFAQPSLKSILEQATGPSASPTAVPGEAPTKAESQIPEDEYQRGTPRSAIEGFLAAGRKGDHQRAAEYLDLRRLPPRIASQDGASLARHLRTVLDRTLWIDLEALSNSPEGKSNDGLSPSRDRLGIIETPKERVELILQRVPRADGVMIWKISSETVRRIPDLYEAFGDGLLGEYLPAFFFEYEFGTVRLWQWIALGALIPAAYLVAWLLSALALRLLDQAWQNGGRRVSRSIAGALRLALTVSIFTSATRFLGLSLLALGVLRAIDTTLLVIAFAWVASRFLDGIGQVFAVRLRRRGKEAALPLIGPGVRTAKIASGGIALLVILASYGFDVTAVVAGLGVGGIAVALAAQKSIENFFGGLSLFADQPVRVGDFCRFGDKIGTVEEIGLRSTRVRTLDRTLVTIPNAEFSQLQLENFAVRDRFRFAPTISLRYDTSTEQLRWILVEIKRLLDSHPKVDPEPARVRFTRFGAYSLDLEIFAYLRVTAVDPFLEAAEDLNLRILDIIRASGTDFAFPTQTEVVEEGKGIDPERTEKAEEQVREWRRRGEPRLRRFDLASEPRSSRGDETG